MIQYQGFKPDALKRIAGTLGYQGNMSEFSQYLNDNPDKKKQMDTYQQKAMQLAYGGAVRKQYNVGGLTGLIQVPYGNLPEARIEKTCRSNIWPINWCKC